MKKIIILIIAFCFINTDAILAQKNKKTDLPITEQFLQMFKDHESDFTVVRITPKMFEMLAQLAADDPKMDKLAKNMQGLYMVSCEKSKPEYTKHINEMTRKLTKEYEALMEVNDGKSIVQILTKSKNGKVEDFVVIVNDEKEFMLMNILGDISLKDLAGLQSTVNIKGLDKVDKAAQADSKKK